MRECDFMLARHREMTPTPMIATDCFNFFPRTPASSPPALPFLRHSTAGWSRCSAMLPGAFSRPGRCAAPAVLVYLLCSEAQPRPARAGPACAFKHEQSGTGSVSARPPHLLRLKGGFADSSGRAGRGGKLERGDRVHRPPAAHALARDIRRGGDDSVLRHFLGKETHVKCEGRRDFTGIVLSYDSYGNLVLGNTTELIMEYPDEDDDMPVFTGRTRFLGQMVCNGKNVLGLWPTEGEREIDNPFPEHEPPGLADSGVPIDPVEDLPARSARFPSHDEDQEYIYSGAVAGVRNGGLGGEVDGLPGVTQESLDNLSQLGGGWSHLEDGLGRLNLTRVATEVPPE